MAVLCQAGPAAAQDPAEGGDPPAAEEGGAEAETETPAPAPEFVPIPMVAARSDELRTSLRQATERLARIPEVASIEAGLPDLNSTLGELATGTDTLLQGSPTLEQLSDAERAWADHQRELSLWRETLAKRAAEVEEELSSLKLARERWERTRAAAQESQAPPDVIAAIQSNLDAISSTRKLATKSRRELLTLLNGVAQEELRASEAVSAIASARAAIRARILEPDSAPLWAALSGPARVSTIPERVRSSIEADGSEVIGFVGARYRALLPVALAFAAALAAALFARTRLRRRQPSAALAGSVAVFARPYSIAAIAAFLTGVAALPFAPAIARDVVGAFLVLPVLRVVLPLVHKAFRPTLYALSAFYLADRARDLVDAVVVLERFLFFLETVAATAFFVWLLRPSRLSSFPADVKAPPPILPLLVRVATGLLAGSSLANLLGYTTFGRVLGEGVLQTAYLSVLFYAAFRIGMTCILVTLSTSRAQGYRLVQSQGSFLLRWSRLLLTLGLSLLWIDNVLGAFTIREPVMGALSSVLTTPLTLGTVSVSLGDVLGFAVTILVAVVLSRVVRVLLNEDVLPLFPLRRGVANAISTSARYAILLGGFFLAMGAAGVDFSRFTLLAGAFGVGIGFGLQNVVNNFVSGLILLFERPVQVGDTVEVGGLLGDVKQIGIRASTVRTFQGAEVIVPNGNLISAEVINWTLSDQHRRVEIPVGVAYGHRPARVIEILQGVVSGDPRMLGEPPPQVLFRGFGESSLDFEVRFWVPDLTTYLQLWSDVATSIYDALDEAGIEIPFPQRDLHLKSVDASAAAQLRDGDDAKG